MGGCVLFFVTSAHLLHDMLHVQGVEGVDVQHTSIDDQQRYWSGGQGLHETGKTVLFGDVHSSYCSDVGEGCKVAACAATGCEHMIAPV